MKKLIKRFFSAENFFSKEELEALYFNVVFLNPMNYLKDKSNVIWSDTKSEGINGPTLNNLYLKYKSSTFGYIQEITIDSNNSRIVIGHLGLDPKYLATGLSKKLILSFGEAVKNKYNVTAILFDERKADPAHINFFTNTLGAATILGKHSKSWLWNIP